MKLRTLVAAGVVAVALAASTGTAAAIDCTNLSRPAFDTTNVAPTYSFGGGAVQIWIRGNWAWISTGGGSFWTFIPPGSGEAALLDELGVVVSAPGANGNYTNGRH